MNRIEEDRRRLLDWASMLAACRDNAVDRSTLQAELDVSRATVYRRTSTLVEEGLLERTRDGYRTTTVGCALTEVVATFDRSIDAIDGLRPLVEAVGAPEFVHNVELFADADLAVATPAHPNEPIDLWREHFGAAEYLRGMIDAGCPPQITAAGVAHAEGGVDMAIICTPQALAADRNASGESAEVLATADSSTLLSHPDLPLSFCLTDTVVLVVGFDEETTLPVAVAVTEETEAREWAERLYARYEREAEPLDGLARSPAAE